MSDSSHVVHSLENGVKLRFAHLGTREHTVYILYNSYVDTFELNAVFRSCSNHYFLSFLCHDENMPCDTSFNEDTTDSGLQLLHLSYLLPWQPGK